MWKNIRLYLRLSGQNVRALLEYKNDFIVSTVAGTVMQTVGLLFLFVLFGNIQSIGGWTLYEVALLYGSLMIAEGALTLLFQGTSSLTYYVRSGQFDRFLLRPAAIEAQLLGSSINFAGLGTMAMGVAVLCVSIAQLQATPPPWAVALFAANMMLGVAIRVNLNLATTSTAFWLISTGGFTTLVYNAQEFARYPITIYPAVIRIVLLTILPHAMISYIPVCLLLGRLPLWPFVLAVPASLAFMVALRRWIFAKALRRYESAGN